MPSLSVEHLVEYDALCICVEQFGMRTDVQQLARDYAVRGVNLPTANVTHSGVAAAMLLSSLGPWAQIPYGSRPRAEIPYEFTWF